MNRYTSAVLALVLVVACSSNSESTESGDSVAPEESAPTSAPVVTTVVQATTDVPATDVPATDVPTTDVPATNPPPTQSVATDPSPTDPPATDASPDSTNPPPAMPTGATVVVHADGGGFAESHWTPLGWWDGSGWNRAGFDETGTAIVVPLPTLSSVSATGLDLPGGVTSGHSYGSPGTFCVDDRTGPTIDLGVLVSTTPVSYGYSVVAVAADWPLQPRPVVEAGVDAEIYQEVGESLANDPKVDPSTGDVVQVVRADLDGDGVEEVLVAFERITNDFGTAGDFSIVYVRFPEPGGTVADEVLFEYYPDEPVDFPLPGQSSVLGVADLNGDGVMEVILREVFWEYAGAVVYSLEDGALTAVMSGGCGV